MTLADYLIQLTMSVFLIFGVYQFYFWCQRQPISPSRFNGPIEVVQTRSALPVRFFPGGESKMKLALI